MNLKAEEKKKTNPDKKPWRHKSNGGIITDLPNNIHIGLSDVIQSSAKPGLQ